MINSPLLIQGVTIMFCNGFVLSSWAVTVHLSEENPWDASGRSLTHSLSDWGRQILHLMPFLCGKQRFLQRLQSHTADPVSLYASLINFDCFHSVAVKFSSLTFFFIPLCRQDCPNLDWAVYCHGNRTVFSRDKHCISSASTSALLTKVRGDGTGFFLQPVSLVITLPGRREPNRESHIHHWLHHQHFSSEARGQQA